MIRLFKSFKEYTDSGFSSSPEIEPERLLDQNRTLNVKKMRMSFLTHLSVFHELDRCTPHK